MTNSVNKAVKNVISQLEHIVNLTYRNDCTFWACDGNPENNRIKTMITCSRCQTIIITKREIKKLEKLL